MPIASATEVCTTTFSRAQLRAPAYWATRMPVAIVSPPATASSTNTTGKLTVTAANSRLPSPLPTQTALMML